MLRRRRFSKEVLSSEFLEAFDYVMVISVYFGSDQLIVVVILVMEEPRYEFVLVSSP